MVRAISCPKDEWISTNCLQNNLARVRLSELSDRGRYPSFIVIVNGQTSADGVVLTDFSTRESCARCA